MPMNVFTDFTLVDDIINSDFHGADYNGIVSSIIEQIQAHLINSTRCRYYDASKGCIDENGKLILSYATDSLHKKHLGFTIDLKATTYYSQVSLRPRNEQLPPYILGEFNDISSKSQNENWIKTLMLKNCQWIDIPIRDTNNILMGLLAVDWPLDISPTSDDLSLFKILSIIFSHKLEYYVRKKIDDIEKMLELFSENEKYNNLHDCLREVSKTLIRTLDVKSVSVFEYNWNGDVLNKLFEFYSHNHDIHPLNCEEQYYCSDSSERKLTAEMWCNHEALRNDEALDYNEISQNIPHQIYSSSEETHQEAFGKITSILYKRIPQREPRFMFRVMNREDAGLPITKYHARIVDKICHDLVNIIDKRMAKRRLKHIQSISCINIADENRINNLLDKVRELFQYEGINTLNGVIVYRSSFALRLVPLAWKAIPSSYFDRLDNLDLDDDKNDANILIKTIKKHAPEIVTAVNDRDKQYFLPGINTESILFLPFSDGGDVSGIVGGLFLPICDLRNNNQIANYKDFATIYPSKAAILKGATLLIKRILEAENSFLIAEKAERLIGHIGHEVSTPLSEIANFISNEIDILIDKNADDVEYTEPLRNVQNEFRSKLRWFSKALDMAVLTAQEHEGRIQINIKSTSILDVMQSAIRTLRNRDELVVTEYGRHYRKFNIELKPSCFNIKKANIDPDLFLQVFLNLFRNSIKYSYPKERGDNEIKIEVSAEHQNNMEHIQIKNWGKGIPRDRFEDIFKPFFRIDSTDSKRAIRGMGLGLYIVRKILQLHSPGKVFCKSSTTPLNDPVKIASYEGYETVFEVRIPTNLECGISWKKWN